MGHGNEPLLFLALSQKSCPVNETVKSQTVSSMSITLPL